MKNIFPAMRCIIFRMQTRPTLTAADPRTQLTPCLPAPALVASIKGNAADVQFELSQSV